MVRPRHPIVRRRRPLGVRPRRQVDPIGRDGRVDARLERLRVVRVDGEERGVVVAVDPALGVRLGTFDGADVGGLSLKKSGREKQREGGGV
jgi:hypothetical protein